jgi:hypothetical protein
MQVINGPAKLTMDPSFSTTIVVEPACTLEVDWDEGQDPTLTVHVTVAEKDRAWSAPILERPMLTVADRVMFGVLIAAAVGLLIEILPAFLNGVVAQAVR